MRKLIALADWLACIWSWLRMTLPALTAVVTRRPLPLSAWRTLVSLWFLAILPPLIVVFSFMIRSPLVIGPGHLRTESRSRDHSLRLRGLWNRGVVTSS